MVMQLWVHLLKANLSFVLRLHMIINILTTLLVIEKCKIKDCIPEFC